MIKSNILSLFSSIEDNIEKRRLISDYEEVIKSISENLHRLKGHVSEDLGSGSDYRKTIDAICMRTVRTDSLKTIEIINARLMADKDKFVTLLEKSFESVLVKSTLDYKNLNLLNFINAVRFYERFARYYLVTLVAYERHIEDYPMTGVERSARDFIVNRNNVQTFTMIIPVLINKIEDLDKSLKVLEDVQVRSELDPVSQGVSITRVDIFKSQFLPLWMNPVFGFGRLYDKVRLYFYEEAKTDVDRLLACIQSLEARRNGSSSETEIARYERAIESYNTTLTKAREKIEDFEEEYGRD